MEEENFEKLYNESLNEKKFDKRITGTVIQISRKVHFLSHHSI